MDSFTESFSLSPALKDFISGAVAGAFAITVSQPLDTVRVRIQQASLCTAHQNALGVLINLIRREGLLSPFRGLTYPLLFASVQSAILFQAYGWTLRQLAASQPAPVNHQHHQQQQRQPQYQQPGQPLQPPQHPHHPMPPQHDQHQHPTHAGLLAPGLVGHAHAPPPSGPAPPSQPRPQPQSPSPSPPSSLGSSLTSSPLHQLHLHHLHHQCLGEQPVAAVHGAYSVTGRLLAAAAARMGTWSATAGSGVGAGAGAGGVERRHHPVGDDGGRAAEGACRGEGAYSGRGAGGAAAVAMDEEEEGTLLAFGSSEGQEHGDASRVGGSNTGSSYYGAGCRGEASGGAYGGEEEGMRDGMALAACGQSGMVEDGGAEGREHSWWSAEEGGTTSGRDGEQVHGSSAGVAAGGTASAFLGHTQHQRRQQQQQQRVQEAQAPLPLPWHGFLAGGVAGLAQVALWSPVELLKLRAQLQTATPGSAAYRNPAALAVQVVRQDGLAGLYRGFSLTVVRDVPSFAMYFWIYHDIAGALSPGLHPEQAPASTQVVAGGLAGVLAWTPIYPLDVLKTRVQAVPASAAGGKTLLQYAREMYAEAGARAFFRGLSPTLVRAFIMDGASFLGYTTTLKLLGGGGEEQGTTDPRVTAGVAVRSEAAA